MRWQHLLAVFVLLTPLVVWMMRRDYRQSGKLSRLSFSMMLLWLFVPHLTLDVVTRYQWPRTPLQVAGAVLAAAGLATSIVAIGWFGSIPKVFCLEPGALTVSGPYRWSRNPQYVGWFAALLGIAVCWWTWPCLVALGMMAAAIHALVLVEEEHLHRVFGDTYTEFRRRTPRYLGRVRL